MTMVTPHLSSIRLVSICIFLLVSFMGSENFATAEDDVQTVSSPTTRTVVAEVLEVEGDFHIVRGERGEIRIEVTSETRVTEEFTFGDRIKAVLLPNDVARSIVRATPNEPIGIMTNEPSKPAPTPSSKEVTSTSEASNDDEEITSPLYQDYQVSKVRVIIADILMVDGSFYIVRNENGEIQIEITEKTDLSEEFKFGDRIKARITPADKALTVTRVGKNEPTGLFEEVSAESKSPPASTSPAPKSPTPPPPTGSPSTQEKKTSESPEESAPSNRIIVADVLMVDGDFYIVRGERGEIQIEVTPKTTISETFDYGDRIKAEVLPNNKAIKIERAAPNDPIGITTP